MSEIYLGGRDEEEAISNIQESGQVGSQVILINQGTRVNLSVPQHNELSTGTIRALIRNPGLTIDDFLSLL